MLVALNGIVHSKMKIMALSPSICSKPVSFWWTQKMIFLRMWLTKQLPVAKSMVTGKCLVNHILQNMVFILLHFWGNYPFKCWHSLPPPVGAALTSVWRFMCSLRVNFFPQISQGYGLSPVCERMCLFKMHWCMAEKLQYGHLNFFLITVKSLTVDRDEEMWWELIRVWTHAG